MAIGFTPKHIENLPLDDLNQQQFIVLAIEAIETLKWRVDYVSPNGIIAYTNKGIFATNAAIEIKITDGYAILKSESTGSEMFDLGKNKKFIRAFISVFNELKLSLSLEEIESRYNELCETFLPEEEDILNMPPPTTTDKIKNLFSIFRPTHGYYITPLLININIAIFLMMLLAGVNILTPDNTSLISWGANFRPITLDGQWWRLVTNCFLHIGILHLIFNMYALVYIGILLEPYLGSKRFVAAYLLIGIVASTTSLAWHQLTISAGASGAIFGLYGVFLALLTTNLIDKKSRKPLLTSIGVFVVFNLLNGFKAGIDNAAHVGGLLSGIVIGYAFIPSLKSTDYDNIEDIENKSVAISSIVILVAVYFALAHIPNDLGKYDASMQTFVKTETKALNILTDTASRNKYRIAYEIKYKGVPYWEENLKLLDEADKLNIPYRFHHRNAQLKAYCLLRIETYNLIYKSIDEKTFKYQAQIIANNDRILQMITELREHEKEGE
ncbi:rhomboid family intramembrane serine protease [Mucilaginibacter glaciei]|uniref:Rhomboid family intramembrane serine protease n=1 Tax=Mucilaginibacter glaciei TaxID=2772109 RepID=A0A926NLN6_9SPHI|nr:rhomboid family intramembrane serine protease [Mucilaginibacter glaciei]MBD1391936.1 rhomboid family intramembrane serine protease [Mucilaginibacter glaciei]